MRAPSHRPCGFVRGTLLALVLIAAPRGSFAWLTDGNVVCALSPSLQSGPAIVQSFDGKALVLWSDTRAGAEDIYARFIDSTGTLAGAGDIAVGVAASFQNGPAVVSDGAGGGIVAWMDNRAGNYDIYAQRLDLNGTALWTANGVGVCTAAGAQRFHAICGDGLVSLTGALPGAYVAWQDDRSGTGDIYVQHLTSAGATWAAPVGACTAAGAQTNVVATGDGVAPRGSASGVIVAWVDARVAGSDIYAQRLSNAGAPQWAADGVGVCTATGGQADVHMVQVGGGAAVLVWTDSRGATPRIYAQKLDATGTPQWQADGIPVATGPAGSQSTPAIVSAGGGAVVIAWADTRTGGSDIYAQKLDATGAALWQAGGIPICTRSTSDTAPLLVGNANAFLVAWSADASDLYAHRLGWDGELLWPTNGIPVTRATGVQSAPKMTGDAAYGACLAWQDTRNGNNDVYALRIGPSLVTDAPRVPVAPGLSLAAANPTQGSPRLTLALDRAAKVFVDVLDPAGRVVATLARGDVLPAGRHELVWRARATNGAPCPAGLYFARARAGGAATTLKLALVR